MNIETAIRQVHRLLKLAGHANTSVEEAAVAAGKAQELMLKFKIQALAVENAALDTPPEEPIVHTKTQDAALAAEGRLAVWKVQVASALARMNSCHIYTRHRYNVKRNKSETLLELVGRQSDIETVRYFYAYLTKEIDRVTKLAGTGKGRSWCNSFRHGMAKTIAERLYAAKKGCKGGRLPRISA